MERGFESVSEGCWAGCDEMYGTIRIPTGSERCRGCGYCYSVRREQILGLSNDYNSGGHHYAIVEGEGGCSGRRFRAIMCPEVVIEIDSPDQREEGVNGVWMNPF